ncbi:cation:proton antiporter [Brevundimonas sp.]|uniref:cation:proton antiporter domain-containing protein n=1 Tax=Brevundimonas sp. TaxID=1871086 RepID=UPI003BA86662
MPHADSLILTLVGGFVLAFVFGMLANRLKLSPLVGYLVAGIIVGPYTGGWTADTELAPQLAEIGVILLMFGVGLHFSPADLMKVRKIAIPGALVQISVATVLGWALGRFVLNLPDTQALLMGFALSVASTVVLIRALEERKQSKGDIGRIAVGWLIVEDLVIVIALVMLPLVLVPEGTAIDGGTLALSIGWTLVKVAVFVGLMLVVGGRVLPWLLVRIAHTKSRELFTLGVLSIALGIAWVAYEVFGASFALGAFVAGLVLNGTPLGHNAAERSLPLRDAFAVLFFVSVGMLFDPTILWREPLAVLGVLAIIIVGKSIAALIITTMFKLDRKASLTVAASLAQIGEFSFILAAIGLQLGAMTQETYALILSGALLSISLNPFVFKLIDRMGAAPDAKPAVKTSPAVQAAPGAVDGSSSDAGPEWASSDRIKDIPDPAAADPEPKAV